MTLLQNRMELLYRRANTTGADAAREEILELLAEAAELLHTAGEYLGRVNRLRLDERDAHDQERRRYRELFDSTPLGFIVTGLDGTIRQVNGAAAELFHAGPKLLVGRSLSLFLPEGQRRPFRADLAGMRDEGAVREWKCMIQPWEGPPVQALLTAGAVAGPSGRPHALHWLVRMAEGVTAEGLVADQIHASELLRERAVGESLRGAPEH
jgi:PAS domain S-box-containing protein